MLHFPISMSVSTLGKINLFFVIATQVLPKEINALCDYYPEHHGVLSFKKGDPLTIIEAR